MELCSDLHAPINYMISCDGLSCEQVAMHLCKVGIPGSVVEQRTIHCDKTRTKCIVENGCILTMYNTSIEAFRAKVVEPLHSIHPLKCGYVRVDGVYVGCVRNLFRKSECDKASTESSAVGN